MCIPVHVPVEIIANQQSEENLPDLNPVLEDGYTPFHLAAMFNNITLFEFLIPHVEDPFENSDNEDRISPIELAIKYGNAEIVELFSQHFMQCEEDYEFGLIISSCYGHKQFAKFFINQMKDPFPAVLAAKYNALIMEQNAFADLMENYIALYLFSRIFVV